MTNGPRATSRAGQTAAARASRSAASTASSSAWRGWSHLDRDAREGEIGYAVGAAARGRGVATEAVGLLTRWGFDELGLERIVLLIDVANAASERIAERCGYTREGILRSAHVKEGLRGGHGRLVAPAHRLTPVDEKSHICRSSVTDTSRFPR